MGLGFDEAQGEFVCGHVHLEKGLLTRIGRIAKVRACGFEPETGLLTITVEDVMEAAQQLLQSQAAQQ